MASKKVMINKRIFMSVEPNSCGSIQYCAVNMPSHAELEKIFKDEPMLKLGKPLPKAIDRYMDRMLKIDIRPKPDLYDLVNGWKDK